MAPGQCGTLFHHCQGACTPIPCWSRGAPLAFPQAVAAPNVLYTAFTNANAMLHVVNRVANAARIESGAGYRFYAEGMTQAVARRYQAINRERVAVATALGATVQRLTYNSDGPCQSTGAPSSLDHKLITEDVPTGLIPMSALGTTRGCRHRQSTRSSRMVRSITGNDFAAEGRTLARLGLGGISAAEIRLIMNDGFV